MNERKSLFASHRCDFRCVCPIHGTPLYYSPSTKKHACQDPECEHAHGMRPTPRLDFTTNTLGDRVPHEYHDEMDGWG